MQAVVEDLLTVDFTVRLKGNTIQPIYFQPGDNS